MQLEAFIREIIESDADQWLKIGRPTFIQDHQQVSSGERTWIEIQEHDSLYTYKHNLNISIATGLPHRDEFHEDWAGGFPANRASSEYIDLLWCGRPVHREVRVLVDGGRAGLPVPEFGTMNVSSDKVALFRLIEEISGGTSFDRYFSQAGLISKNLPWF